MSSYSMINDTNGFDMVATAMDSSVKCELSENPSTKEQKKIFQIIHKIVWKIVSFFHSIPCTHFMHCRPTIFIFQCINLNLKYMLLWWINTEALVCFRELEMNKSDGLVSVLYGHVMLSFRTMAMAFWFNTQYTNIKLHLNTGHRMENKKPRIKNKNKIMQNRVSMRGWIDGRIGVTGKWVETKRTVKYFPNSKQHGREFETSVKLFWNGYSYIWNVKDTAWCVRYKKATKIQKFQSTAELNYAWCHKPKTDKYDCFVFPQWQLPAYIQHSMRCIVHCSQCNLQFTDIYRTI